MVELKTKTNKYIGINNVTIVATKKLLFYVGDFNYKLEIKGYY